MSNLAPVRWLLAALATITIVTVLSVTDTGCAEKFCDPAVEVDR